jgi:hypothetical protein
MRSELNAAPVTDKLAHTSGTCLRHISFATVRSMPISWNEIRHKQRRIGKMKL